MNIQTNDFKPTKELKSKYAECVVNEKYYSTTTLSGVNSNPPNFLTEEGFKNKQPGLVLIHFIKNIYKYIQILSNKTNKNGVLIFYI